MAASRAAQTEGPEVTMYLNVSNKLEETFQVRNVCATIYFTFLFFELHV